MIISAFGAFSIVTTGIDPDQRENIRAVAILLYSGMFFMQKTMSIDS
jgi:hypothetical protein